MVKQIYYLLFLLHILSPTNTDAAACENGWSAYRDELCVKTIDALLTNNEGKNRCTAEGASLVMIKNADFQNYISGYTQDVYNMMWLGGTYAIPSSQYKWEDGDVLTYTNWQEGYPHNNTERETCIELRPSLSRASINTGSKWADVACLKRNLVMCQKPLQWTLQDAVDEIRNLRKQVIPVGSTYVEYAGQPSPPTLWPTLVWEDITSSYGGLFFRALGGGSAEWQDIQNECAHRLTKVAHVPVDPLKYPIYPEEVTLPKQGWSEYVSVGNRHDTEDRGNDAVRFHTDDCEVRPRNQAVRIWRRKA